MITGNVLSSWWNNSFLEKLENVEQLFVNGNADSSSLFLPCCIMLLVFLWVIVLIWVAKDISVRTKSTVAFLWALFCILIFTPLFGLLIYLVLRPKKTLDEQLKRREALETTVVECGSCGEINLINNKFCTGCGDKLTIKCRECSKEFSSSYGYCPFCGAPNIE